MTKAAPRYMSFNLRSVDSEGQGEVWHWLIYEDPNEYFLRNGQVAGDRKTAEQAARAAIALMGGVVRATQGRRRISD